MKLIEPKERVKKRAGRDLLGQVSHEPSLNESMGLNQRVKERLKSLIRPSEEHPGLVIEHGKVATDLIVLFPNAMAEIVHQTPIDQLVKIAHGSTKRPFQQLEALSSLRFLAPETVTSVELSVEELVKNLPNADPIWLANRLVRAFPKKREVIMKLMASKLAGTVNFSGDLGLKPPYTIIPNNLDYLRMVIEIEPAVHQIIHAKALKFQQHLHEKTREFIKTVDLSITRSEVEWLAAYKLIMAKRITQGPNDIWIADEQDVSLREKIPLPERNMAE